MRQKECIEGGDTYNQLDLLGRAAVGRRGCRVGRFALASRVHGRAMLYAKTGVESAIADPGLRALRD